MNFPSIKVKTSDLIPYANNSRTHSDAQVAQICASIKELGFTNWRYCIENDCYAVTDCGSVLRVCRRQNSKSGNVISKYKTIILKGSFDKDGYKTYRIRVNGVKKHLKAHRLILNAFVGESELQVNHKDGNKKNNSLRNLEWVTAKENNDHAVKTGLWTKKFGINQKIHPSNYVSIYIMIKHLKIKRCDIAKLNNVSRQTIDMIFNKTKEAVHDDGRKFNEVANA